MRAASCIVAALAFATPALAQVSEDITHPPVVAPNVTATIRTTWESTRDDGVAFARAWFSDFTDPFSGGHKFQFDTRVQALGTGNTSEATIQAEFNVAAPVVFNWEITGPGTLDLTGPTVDVHIVTKTFNSRPFDRDDALPPGIYQMTIAQSLVSGQYPDTARALVFALVVPEPSTWAIAGVALVVFSTHMRRYSGCRLNRP
jgi:hypothetical protein